MKQPIPNLVVDAIEPSLAFWVERLGFTVAVEVPHGDHLGFVILVHGDASLQLQARASVAEDVPLLATVAGVATVYLPVDDVAVIARALEGYEHIVVPTRDTWYGMRELVAREPGGHFVFFAQALAPTPA